MGFLSHLFPWGLILQGVALVHFIRRRPETYWLWIILFLGPLGALIYIVMEVVPDLGLLRQSFDGFSRRQGIAHLEAVVRENPSVGNYEELGGLYFDEGKYAEARQCYDQAIAAGADHLDPVYRRGLAALNLNDFAAAARDLEQVIAREPKYDFQRAIGLLGHAYANSGQADKAQSAFERATQLSTLTETYFNYALFLAAQGRTAEARDWAQKILSKKAAMPRYVQRRERPWFNKAGALLKRLPASG
jgi:hypothetical protein